MRVLYFGGRGALSCAVLRRLLQQDVVVAGVVLSGFGPAARPADAIAVAAPERAHSIQTLAAQAGVAMHYIEDPAADSATAAVADVAADVGISVCFPRRLPRSLWSLPRFDSFNLHPSLLPAFRGPAPLFWQLQQGLTEIGVSLHALSDEFDAGELVGQRSLALHDGLDHPAICELVADTGADMLGELLLAPGDTASRRPQTGPSSHYPAPVAQDFALQRDWSARHAFNFVRGTRHWCRQFPLHAGGRSWRVLSATAYAAAGRLDGDYRCEQAGVWFQFNPGVLYCRVGDDGGDQSTGDGPGSA